MELTQTQIEEINKKCPLDQGVFREPYGIPVHIKEPVIYCRYEVGGYRGGSCWGGVAHRYQEDPPSDRMKVLELVLADLRPKISFLEYRILERLIQDEYDSDLEYYGNSTEYTIEYIKLSDLYAALEKMDN